MKIRFVLVLSVVAAVAVEARAQAPQGPLHDPIPQPIPQSAIQVSLTPVANGLISPIALVPLGKGDDNRPADRKFVVDQTGLVLLMKGGVIQPTPFLDITGVIAQLSPAFGRGANGLNPGYDERGLLGLAFHPDFHDRDSAGYRTLYTLHNVPVARVADFPQPPFPPNAIPNCQEVIAEWKTSLLNPDVVDPASYREVLRYDKPEFNHCGGTVAFGHDGLLYAALGDGGAANDVGAGHTPGTGNAQVLNTILGKVIRINPLLPRLSGNRGGTVSANGQYRIPWDNPFVTRIDNPLAAPTGALGEIYAFGFRNPYRFSFDSHDGRLILADVGQNNIEEVDIVRRGKNYGWHLKEGTFLFDPATGNVFSGPSPDPTLVDPVVEYDHFEATANAITRIAVVGGFVYHGSRIPALRGKYICADLNGFLFVADLERGRLELLMKLSGMFIKGFGQDTNGEVFVLASGLEGPSGHVASILSIDPVPGASGRDGDD